MELAEAIGRESFYRYFEAYGFTEKTGIDLAGEVDSIYHRDFSGFNETELAVYSFGQTFKITPLSLIRAVSAVANGGNLVQPRVVKALVDDDGNVIKEYKSKVVRQVNSVETSETIMGFLDRGITMGSTKNAYVKGYSVGAKTGTSQKRDIQDENLYIASCVAFAPTDDPEIAILIVIDEPVGVYYGGTIAAPVVSAVLTEVLPYLGVETSSLEDEEQAPEVTVEDYVGFGLSSAETSIKNSLLKYKVYGKGDVVLNQFPRYGTKLREGGIVVLYTDMEEHEKIVVPDVVGQRPTTAMKSLINYNLNIKMEGAYRDGVDGTIATRQTPEKGTEVAPGTIVSVEFHHLDNSD